MNLWGKPAIANAIVPGTIPDNYVGHVYPSNRRGVIRRLWPTGFSLLETAISPLRSFSLAFLPILFCCVSIFSTGTLAASVVGTVTKVQHQARIGSKSAEVGVPVHMHDQISTGPDARLEITFRDNTTLTLGENARVAIDRYVYNPGNSIGAMTVNATRGALQFATGQLGSMRNKDITITTPAAALAVRGTAFWAGIVDFQFGVLLLSKSGRVHVSNSVGAVTLSSTGQGTDIPPSLKQDSAPGRPYIWPADKVARALAQTSFGAPLGSAIPGLLVPLLPIIPNLTDDDPPRPASP